jgi:Lipocalin-like domain
MRKWVMSLVVFGLIVGVSLMIRPTVNAGSMPDLRAGSDKDIAGTWALVSADGFGPAPLGSLMFDTDGHFSAIFLRAGQPKYASNSRTQGTADEYKATVDGSVAVFGTYKFDLTELTLHVIGSTFPNWIGTDQKRVNVTVTTNELRWTQPTPSGGGAPSAVVWRRLE